MASSSILWPYLLVAAGALTGVVGTLLPLILNILFSLATLALAAHVLRRFSISSYTKQTAALALLATGVPLVSVTLVGMEHLLFTFAFLLFLWLAGEASDGGQQPHSACLPWAAMLLTASRFEGVFAVAVACLLLGRRHPRQALFTAIAGALPVACFSFYSLRHGGMWLPNSVLMKVGSVGVVWPHLYHAIEEITAPSLWKSGFGELLLLVAWTAWCGRERPTPLRAMQRIYLGTVALHLTFARLVSGTTRYDAYLTCGGLLLGFAGLERLFTTQAPPGRAIRLTAQLLAGLTLLPLLLYRGIWLEFASARSAASIYRQQYQTAQFLARYYPGQAVAAGDVGAISYFADVACFDLNGLANNDTARLLLTSPMYTPQMERLAIARGVRIGVLYGNRYEREWSLPASWIKVRSWRIPTPKGATVSEPVVDFYATSPAEAGPLLRNLKAFEPSLPPEVTVLP